VHCVGFVTQGRLDELDSVETKEDRVRQDHPDRRVQWDLRDRRDFLEQLDCLGDLELRAKLAPTARLEYLVDTLASTSQSNFLFPVFSASPKTL